MPLPRVNLDAGALARYLGDRTLSPEMPGELTRPVIPVLSIEPFVAAPSESGASFPAILAREERLAIAAPGAAQDFIITVPAGQVWRFKFLRLVINCAAVAGTRVIEFAIRGPDNVEVITIHKQGDLLSGQAGLYNFWPGAPRQFVQDGSTLHINENVPWGTFLLRGGWVFRSVSSSYQAGDQWQAGSAMVERYAG